MSILSPEPRGPRRSLANGMIVKRSDFVAALVELETLAAYIEVTPRYAAAQVSTELAGLARQFRALMAVPEGEQ